MSHALIALPRDAQAGPYGAPSFQGLGDLPTGAFRSQASGLSGDGRFVVGRSTIYDDNLGQSVALPFIWDATLGMRPVGVLPSDVTSGWASDISDDGGTVVGYFYQQGAYTSRAFRHDVASGSTVMIDPVLGDSTYAYGVSGDGSLVVGEDHLFDTTQSYGLVYDDANGARILGNPPGQIMQAMSASSDGTFIVGTRANSTISDEAVRWDAVNGVQGLGFLPGATTSVARAVSDDGSVVVGQSGSQAARFDVGVGVTGLGFLPGKIGSHASDVSADGTRIVGASTGAGGPSAFVWDEEFGMIALSVLLEQLGIDLTGWTLTSAVAISDDGRTIAGYGYNPNNDLEAFVATIPEPGTGLLLATGLLGLGLRRRAL